MSDSPYSSDLSAEEREAQEAQQQMLEAQAMLAAAEAKRVAAEARLAEAKLAAAEAQLAEARKNVTAAQQTAKVWPPAPNKPAGAAPAVPTCPACGRKLLTMNSALCNWCGAKINDPEYQQRAAEQRAARDAEDRARIESEREEETKYGFMGSIKRRAKKEPGSKSGFEL